MTASFRDAVSTLKGRKPRCIVAPEASFPVLLPVSAQIKADEAAERLENTRPGDEVSGGDIFFGIWAPTDREGKSLGKTFSLFAQPHDASLENFLGLQERVAGLSKGFNHMAKGKAPDEVLYDALRSGAYKGEYFIPPIGVLDMLFQKKDAGKLAGSFSTDAVFGRYWSSTEEASFFSDVWFLNFSDRSRHWFGKDAVCLSGRLVRAELRP